MMGQREMEIERQTFKYNSDFSLKQWKETPLSLWALRRCSPLCHKLNTDSSHRIASVRFGLVCFAFDGSCCGRGRGESTVRVKGRTTYATWACMCVCIFLWLCISFSVYSLPFTGSSSSPNISFINDSVFVQFSWRQFLFFSLDRLAALCALMIFARIRRFRFKS